MIMKKSLGETLVDLYHPAGSGSAAREEFERVFSERGTPDDIPEHRIVAEAGKIFLPKLLSAVGLCSSRTEANRLLKQGAVSVDGEKLAADKLELEVRSGDQLLFKVGKRRFARVKVD